MRSLSKRLLPLVTFAALAGACFAIGPCDVAQYAADFNPCGTILYCDPLEYEFVQAGYEGPGVDVDVDPFCTYPPLCGSDVDPMTPTNTIAP